MFKRAKASTAAMIAAMMTSAAICAAVTTEASAQEVADPVDPADPVEIVNGQINLDAAINATARAEADYVNASQLTSVGLGNALTVDVIEPHDVVNAQEFSGQVASEAVTDAAIVDGSALTTAAAIGNGVTAISDDDFDLSSDQIAADGSTVSARAGLEVSDYALVSVTTASAAANAVDSIAYGGETRLDLRQDSGADVSADAYIAAPTAGIGVSATLASTASGNTASAQGYYRGPSQLLAVDQSNRGAISARTRVEAGGGAEDLIVVSQANGNTARIQNEDAYAQLQGAQDNAGSVTAESEVIVPHWDVDIFTVSAEGVGNSALISNFGSNTGLFLDQTNTGAVTAGSSIAGEDGGVGIANSTAFGNAATSYICSECPVTAEGGLRQLNGANVSSNTRIGSDRAASLIGSAFAVGNSATFQTVSPSGD